MTAATLAITDWSAVSPFGTGRDAFVKGVRQQQSTAVQLDRERWGGPDDVACLVPDFDVRTVLGKKGTRSMNRVTGLAVATSGDLLASADGLEVPRESTAFVLGTTVGSAQSTIDLTRGSLTGERPYHVESGLIPYAVMNGAAGQCAIWHGLRGPNATLSAGRPGGLVALNYARRLLLSGRAAAVLCGAAEEYSDARAWIDHHSRDDGAAGPVLGEGCALFSLTTQPELPPLAELLAVASGTFADGDREGAVARCVRRALAAGGAQAQQVWVACPSGAAGAEGDAEIAALNGLFGASRVGTPVAALIGETHAASASFELAALLSRAEDDASCAGRTAVITSVDPGGTAAAALLRLRPDR
ncbi:beta-ketoacyl synthase N-terminal-like domain-containing protein [Actinacidiphila bryophytorum]|uniref:3-oxoacyl-ACP synthase n=1 Tax=Actinacidiphila bryophytorum TaxID=1436133 RepID=A0A9W4H8D5_9ACTN|nr:beta-ketoacyl synthase N-terminal-like domain-containing protein [Actinacidiphila bryophytorum]MBM9438274.1 3-oxoacyl-ACP synthase [Actinacidiphila bryophytorum]MBN6545437.1 3-oxoacyl-ACP synthase [Actinacidiphila bryophytorum]CAG7657845.1 3-oxoacyl-ACP synthase [Actinacidiphila bryophytorum]